MKKLSVVPILCVSLLVFTHAVRAADAEPRTASCVFHVDASHGDDTKDGLTPATAWRSLDKVNRAALRAGDKVLFRRSEIWRGQLFPQRGNETGAITYGAFGEGEKPALLGSVALNRPEDWQPAGDNLWTTVPVKFEPVSTLGDLQKAEWFVHRESGAVCKVSNVKSDDGPNAYKIECSKSGTRSNHIQIGTAGLSVNEGEYYLFTFRARCTKPSPGGHFSFGKQTSPWTSYATTESMTGTIGTDWTEYTTRFRAKQSAKDARLTWYLGGALPEGATLIFEPGKLMTAKCNHAMPLTADVGLIIFDDGKATGFKKWSEPDLKQDLDFLYDAHTWQVTVRSNVNPAKRFRSIELALTKHIISQGNCKYVTYENMALRYGAAHGIGGASTAYITARNLDISYIGGGHQFTPPKGKPVRYGNGIEFWSSAHDCLVEGCRIWEIYDAALTNQGSGTNVQENITYRNNVIWNSEYSLEYWNRDKASRTRNIVFEHNTCVDAGYGWGHRQRPDPNGRHLMFYDNTAATEGVVIRYNIFCNATDSCLRLHGRDWTSELKMDFNCWFQADGPLLLWGKEKIAAADFAEFAKQHNMDTHSIVADPKFVDAANNYYSLSAGSPARRLSNAGVPCGAASK